MSVPHKKVGFRLSSALKSRQAKRIVYRKSFDGLEMPLPARIRVVNGQYVIEERYRPHEIP